MRKLAKRVILCFLITSLCWGIQLFKERKQLSDSLIRFHVVANSDSEQDQAIKLEVRDAVLSGIQEDLNNIRNMEEAKEYLQNNIPKIQRIANLTLADAGFDGNAIVSLCKESFDTRQYDTFSLPAGVYESLRIIIGEGKGRNWWCVAFPSLCLPATGTGFQDAAVGAGFSQELSETLRGERKYEVRFFFLDVMGELENLFFKG